jgi:hypothetical protein
MAQFSPLRQRTPLFQQTLDFVAGMLAVGPGAIPACKLLSRDALPRMNGTISPASLAIAPTSTGQISAFLPAT